MAQKNPLLELSTSVDGDRDFVRINKGKIDEVKCFMRGKQELNIRDNVSLRKMGKRIAQFHRATEMSDEELEEFTDIMAQLMNLIFVDAPQETLDKLTDTQQMEIIVAFTKLLTAGVPEGVIKEAEKKLLKEMKAEKEMTEAQKMRRTAKSKQGTNKKNMNS